MTELDLLQAVGGIQESYLQVAERTASSARTGRGLWRLGLAAAILSMLSLTAAAVQLFSGTVLRSEKPYEYISIYGENHITAIGDYEVRLQLAPAEDAPNTLQTTYLPAALMEDYPSGWCVMGDYGLRYWNRFRMRDGTYANIRYEQYVLPVPKDGTYGAPCRCIPGARVESSVTEYGGIPVLELIFQGEAYPQGGSRQLYWTDGNYIFYLMVPYELDAGAYEELITTLEAADVTPYLIQDPAMPQNTPTETSRVIPEE